MIGLSVERSVVRLAAAALLLSIPLGATPGTSGSGLLLIFAASSAAFLWLAAGRAPFRLRLAAAVLVGVAPTGLALLRASWWTVSLDNLLTALFGAHGLLYGAPLLWCGFLGLIGLRHEAPGLTRLALAAVLPGTLGLLVSTDGLDARVRMMTWAPFLLPGLAHCFGKMRAFAARRPERVLAAGGGLLVLWNALFMEQYRRRLLPSDDTVSFAQVTSNSAGLLSRAVGTPFAWPANWIFAKRLEAPLERWDAIADRRLLDAAAATATIELGDDASIFAPDVPLLLEGFGDRRTCEQGWCRDLDGRGRLLLPLEGGARGDLTLRLRARGQGALSLSLNETSTSVAELSGALSDLSLRIPGRSVRAGVNVLSLSVAEGGRATIDRITLERVPSTSSAR
ncbi:MAG: hypothetical protein K1Y01_05445 [Vicinamibacteria bacterium]|nr:hypothetical protein [Vicinamibacteria bacterium]